MREYVKFHLSEIKDGLIIVLFLSLASTITYQRFSSNSGVFIFDFFLFFLFYIFMLSGKILFMKFFAYHSGFELIVRKTVFDRFWFRAYDTAKAVQRDYLDVKKPKGIPVVLIAAILYLLSFGMIIYPALWRYKTKIIHHKFIGTRHKFEYEMGHMYNQDISFYRMAKVLYLGFLYYFLFGIIIRVFLPFDELQGWFLFFTFWTGFMTLLPILGSEGLDLWQRGNVGWFAALTALFLGLLSLMIFNDLLSILLFGFLTIALTTFIVMYRMFIKK